MLCSDFKPIRLIEMEGPHGWLGAECDGCRSLGDDFFHDPVQHQFAVALPLVRRIQAHAANMAVGFNNTKDLGTVQLNTFVQFGGID